MIKRTIKVLVLVLGVVVVYLTYSYHRLHNPIDEIIYSEMTSIKVIPIKSYSQLIKSDTSYDFSDNTGFVTLHYNLRELLKPEETVTVYMDDTNGFIFSYQHDFKNGRKLQINYIYDGVENVTQSIVAIENDGSEKKTREEILDLLRDDDLDSTWLIRQSTYVWETLLLSVWFEKGSHRYSFDNIGNIQIVKSNILG
ncbi:TipC family immunity protein [Streptococcus suis]|uniref:TipC family immunity protein n=1 Tax=Streptococcus suis TaxID=1307 RepID=UPI00376E77FE